MQIATLKKTQRIWFGAVLGLAVTLVFGWSNGMFAALLPMFVLTQLERWNSGIIVQLIVAVTWVCLQVSFIVGFFQPYPLLMTLVVAIFLLFKCIAMTHKSSYLFGYIGLLMGSILLNFASFSGFDLEDFVMGLIASALVTGPIVALAFYLFPAPCDKPPSANLAPPREVQTQIDNQRKDDIGMMRQAALGWIIAMAAFILFQVADLNDSLSAQSSIFIVLAPMTFIGSMAVAKIRILGTFLGCLAGMMLQLTLYSLANNMILFLLGYAIAAAVFCRWLAIGGVKAGIGFSAMSALTVPLTSSFVPEQQDAFFSICYRFSSIVVAVIVTSLMIWLVHHFLVRLIRHKPLAA
ncbi:DUF2955 domain-containing protein [Shewanella fidelis]|uniref:DUF2955 domain-containing protein n=1 Tax=Shewanella fidelis TaxID=173509 RepID=A0AAW8NL42_9GAMM|nr:DUF2955 domain-containing protein [Shewanella fidelis]MDR8522519.1 DUF2955 domain-containing protein [Shewanella fidelis]MDW4812947.1 DUF2955 domain-containing protein [Shewanella fidelis]MDW4816794.1 DUF2955 domain-containing protein [Shewanella fidelis]MDW4820954.1 DUF2955 domain-containing protein [Shewanella fidelis]MDW4825511.1 DUF2955 domain-containing protein [Shewanella fidelis]